MTGPGHRAMTVTTLVAVLARLQQITVVTWILAVLFWLAWAGGQGRWGLALGGLVVLVGGHAVVLALEFAWMSWCNRRDALPAASATDVIAAWWGEAFSAVRVFGWRQPFRSEAWPDQPHGRPGQRGVVLVHGFVCNRGLWNRWYPKLNEAGIPHVGVNLEPVFGDIDEYTAAIDAAVYTLQARTGLAPVVVAHSMGGLAVRAWLRSRGGAAAMQRVHQVITIGSPHAGTQLAALGLTLNARQMRRHSDWLCGLAAAESPSMLEGFTCVYGNCDNIVFPTSSARLPHARSVQVPRCAHVHLVDHPTVFELVRHSLQPGAALRNERMPGVPEPV
jgi:triacylglycerol lipase